MTWSKGLRYVRVGGRERLTQVSAGERRVLNQSRREGQGRDGGATLNRSLPDLAVETSNTWLGSWIWHSAARAGLVAPQRLWKARNRDETVTAWARPFSGPRLMSSAYWDIHL